MDKSDNKKPNIFKKILVAMAVVFAGIVALIYAARYFIVPIIFEEEQAFYFKSILDVVGTNAVFYSIIIFIPALLFYITDRKKFKRKVCKNILLVFSSFILFLGILIVATNFYFYGAKGILYKGDDCYAYYEFELLLEDGATKDDINNIISTLEKYKGVYDVRFRETTFRRDQVSLRTKFSLASTRSGKEFIDHIKQKMKNENYPIHSVSRSPCIRSL